MDNQTRNSSVLAEELLNNFFVEKGSAAEAGAIRGTIKFWMDNRKFSYPVNLSVTLGKTVFYFFMGGIEGGPFAIKTENLGETEASRKFLVQRFEAVCVWQLERIAQDRVEFNFVANTPLGRNPVTASHPPLLRPTAKTSK